MEFDFTTAKNGNIEIKRGDIILDENNSLFTIPGTYKIANRFSTLKKVVIDKPSNEPVLKPFISKGKKDLIQSLTEKKAYPYVQGPYIDQNITDDLLYYCKDTTQYYYQSNLLFAVKEKEDWFACITFYHSQERMLEVCKQNYHTLCIGFDNPYYDYRKEERSFETSKLYTSFQDVYTFFQVYDIIVDTQKHFYELIHKERPCFLYFDLDCKPNNTPQTEFIIDNQSLLHAFKIAVHEFIHKYYCRSYQSKKEINEEVINVTHASTNEKISLHIVYKEIILENNKDLQRVYSQFEHYIQNEFTSDFPEHTWIIPSIDFCVDSANRLMRILDSCKLLESGEYKRPLQTYKVSENTVQNKLLDSLITNIPRNPSFPVFNKWYTQRETNTQHVPTPVRHKEVDLTIDQFNLEFYEELLDILPPVHYILYNSWFAVACALKNTYYKHRELLVENRDNDVEEDYFQLFSNFSSKCQGKYNECSARKLWNSIKESSTNPTTIASIILFAKQHDQKRVRECFQAYFPQKQPDSKQSNELSLYYRYNKAINTRFLTKELLHSVVKLIPERFWNTSPTYINDNKKYNLYNVPLHIAFAIHTVNPQWMDIWKEQCKLYNIQTDKIITQISERRSPVDYTFLHYLVNRYNREKYETLIERYPQLILKMDTESYTPLETVNHRWLPKELYESICKSSSKYVAIKSNMGTGKSFNMPVLFTHTVIKKSTRVDFEIERPLYESILIITFRRSLAQEFYTKWKQYGFSLYSEEKSQYITSNRIIVQIDSLWRISKDKFDLVICDELVSTVSHLIEFERIKKRNQCFQSFILFLQEATKVIYLDANLSDELCKLLSEKNKVHTILNTYKAYTDITVRYHFGKERFQQFILTYIHDNPGKPFVIMSNCKGFLRKTITLIQELYKEMKLVCILAKDETSKHHAEIERSGEECPTSDWNKYTILMYTPSICAGVSFDELYFHKRFAYFTNDSCGANMCSQMLLRVRHTIEPVIEICVDQVDYDFKPTEYDKIDLYLEDRLDSVLEFIDEETDTKHRFNKDLFYKVYRYIIQQKHISSNHFQEKLSSILADHGMNITHYYPEATPVEKQEVKAIRNANKKSSTEKSKQETNDIISIPLITQKEYEEITGKRGVLTLEERIKLRKHTLVSTFKIDFTQDEEIVFNTVHYLKNKIKSYRLLLTLSQIENIQEIIQFCTRKNSEQNLLNVVSPDDADKLYIWNNWVHIGLIFKLLDTMGFTTITPGSEKIELDWKRILSFLKKNWNTLNEMGKIYTDKNELPDTLEGASEKAQTNVKKVVVMIINNKLNDTICMGIQRSTRHKTSNFYNCYSLIVEEGIRPYFHN